MKKITYKINGTEAAVGRRVQEYFDAVINEEAYKYLVYEGNDIEVDAAMELARYMGYAELPSLNIEYCIVKQGGGSYEIRIYINRF